MADGRDTEPVCYGRWQAAHQALADRVAALEREAGLNECRSAHERFAAQIRELREDVDALARKGEQQSPGS